ncbi:MAG TPA: sulfotransferase family 2 domain-containing protein [Verrucomicrobiales bacterium]|nr:sulfotransferase family 2 domain-containing protein [Verrucomicrobiales bacterium]
MNLLSPLWAFCRTLEDRWARQYLFVHINKTGGSSVEKALNLRFGHVTALEQRRALGNRLWESKFSFAFVRNPWDRVVSQFHYRRERDQTGLRSQEVTFRKWIGLVFGDRNPLFLDKPRMFMPQVDWIADGQGNLMVDYVGRFERLEEDFGEVCRRIGREAILPHVKASNRRSHREYFDDETAGLVGRWYAADVERFGYQF